MSDAELVARARAGDHEAYGELVDRHRSAVYRAALAALGSPQDAEDAVQDAFLAAYRGLAGFRAGATFKTWLLAIAWRHALRRRRGLVARFRRFLSGDALGETPSEPHAPGGLEGRLLDRELAAHVRRLVNALPTKLRDPLLLSASGDHNYDEIGGLLGVPTGTVKWRVVEARRRLRERLARLGYRDE